MTSDLQELIKNASLTKKERLIADYVLSHFRDLCVMTSTELANAVELSHSSVIRFTKDLGFSGYTEFQKAIRMQYDTYLKNHQESSIIAATKTNKDLEKLSKENIPETIEKIANQNIKYVITHNSHEIFDKASDAIIKSKNKYVIGTHYCAASAAFLSTTLRNCLSMVFSEPNISQSTFDFLSDIKRNDCIIIISMPKYSRMSYFAAEMAKKAGATIVIFTDTPTAPIAKFADYLFTIPIDSATFFDSQVPVLFSAEVLCTYITKKICNDNEKKLNLLKYYNSFLTL